VSGAVRTMVLHVAQWPATAAVLAGEAGDLDPLAVMHANRVIACTPAARERGVGPGLRKREAQGRCPELVVVASDAGRDAVLFEPVLAAVEQVAAGVMVLGAGAGACGFAARGPAAYFGGEGVVAEKVIDRVATEMGVEAQIGVADGAFAALLAARVQQVIEPGATPGFLAGLPVAVLGRPQLADLLQRLGIGTLGEFAALPAGDVLARFGSDGAFAHRLAAGLDDRPLEVRQPPTDLTISETFDEPIERVDVAAFAARALAVRLQERLAGYGLAATRLEIGAVTADGQELSRVWRHDGLLDAQAIADRTRWQLEGWLTRRRLTTGIITLALSPQGVLRQGGLQPGLWGEPGADRERAHRAMNRVQGLLGPESVLVGVPSGGRDPQHLVTAVPFGDERVPARPAGPWPGGLPAPYPALSVAEEPARLLDPDGTEVGVSARLAMTGPPGWLEVGGRRLRVVSWWGPWPVVERWWDPETGRRGIRLQVRLDDGTALLLFLTGGRWFVVGRFD
jgi:protein ImuB